MSNKVIEYYDNYINRQKKSGINDRIFSLYKRLKRFGFKSDSNILELGCGIGVLTALLSRKIKNGKIEAVDVSSKSIEYAQKKNTKRNIIFNANDITTYSPSLKNIDFILLFDVLEHIPMENHNLLVENIVNCMKNNTKLLINLPSAESIEFDRAFQPEQLQIIDNALYPKYVVELFENYGLRLNFFETYSVWVRNDYDFYCFKIKNNFENKSVDINKTLVEKIMKKIKSKIVKQTF